ncbi:MAG TPA: hypothetical protein VE091_14300 [Gemmatimonadales bacterium]|nr:hypothetical protein [Gemmatimonadales bacterium]
MNPHDRHERAKDHRSRDERVDRPTPERGAIDPHERLRKLRVMLGEASGSSPASPPPAPDPQVT